MADVTYEYVGDVNPNLLCAICHYPFVDPVTTSSCKHTFCKSCINESLIHKAACPIDRSHVDSSTLHDAGPVVINMLEELKVKCLGEDCGYISQRGLMISHTNICGKTVVKCVHKTCQKPMTREELSTHRAYACDQRKMQCSTCKELVPFSLHLVHRHKAPFMTCGCLGSPQSEDHRWSCDEALVPCEYAELGCPATVKRSDLVDHLDICFFDKVAPCLHTMRDEINQLKKDRDLTFRHINTLIWRRDDEVGEAPRRIPMPQYLREAQLARERLSIPRPGPPANFVPRPLQPTVTGDGPTETRVLFNHILRLSREEDEEALVEAANLHDAEARREEARVTRFPQDQYQPLGNGGLSWLPTGLARPNVTPPNRTNRIGEAYPPRPDSRWRQTPNVRTPDPRVRPPYARQTASRPLNPQRAETSTHPAPQSRNRLESAPIDSSSSTSQAPAPIIPSATGTRRRVRPRRLSSRPDVSSSMATTSTNHQPATSNVPPTSSILPFPGPGHVLSSGSNVPGPSESADTRNTHLFADTTASHNPNFGLDSSISSSVAPGDSISSVGNPVIDTNGTNAATLGSSRSTIPTNVTSDSVDFSSSLSSQRRSAIGMPANSLANESSVEFPRNLEDPHPEDAAGPLFEIATHLDDLLIVMDNLVERADRMERAQEAQALSGDLRLQEEVAELRSMVNVMRPHVMGGAQSLPPTPRVPSFHSAISTPETIFEPTPQTEEPEHVSIIRETIAFSPQSDAPDETSSVSSLITANNPIRRGRWGNGTGRPMGIPPELGDGTPTARIVVHRPVEHLVPRTEGAVRPRNSMMNRLMSRAPRRGSASQG